MSKQYIFYKTDFGDEVLKVILLVIPLVSVVFAVVNGRMSELSTAILGKTSDAVELVISLCGVMCFWCGLMKVAERAGLTEKLAKLLSPAVNFLFKGLKRGGKAAGLIAMNISANILGLGNASTPLGISAMKAIAEEENIPDGGEASDNMVTLAVLNTASLQILPATAAALRSANGSAKPLDILPCVWIVSAYSLAAAIISSKVFSGIGKNNTRNRG